jgi:hypothetical protein
LIAPSRSISTDLAGNHQRTLDGRRSSSVYNHKSFLVSPTPYYYLNITIEDKNMDAALKSGRQHWVHTWAAMPQLAESSDLPENPFVQKCSKSHVDM